MLKNSIWQLPLKEQAGGTSCEAKAKAEARRSRGRRGPGVGGAGDGGSGPTGQAPLSTAGVLPLPAFKDRGKLESRPGS